MEAKVQIKIDDFAKHTLALKDHCLIIDGKPMTIAGKQVISRIVADGRVK